MAECHPDRKHHAKSLCQKCYEVKHHGDYPEIKRAYSAKHYAEHREEKIKSQAEYRSEHREENNAKSAKYYAEHREERLRHQAKYRSEHREERLRQQSEWYVKNRAEKLKRQAKYRSEHREVIAVRNAKYEAEHPELRKANKHNRRTRVQGNGGTFTATDWIELKIRTLNRCLRCGLTEEKLKALGRTLACDHIISIKNGGTSNIDNLQPLCHGRGGCNNRKHSKNTDYRGFAPGWAHTLAETIVLRTAAAA